MSSALSSTAWHVDSSNKRRRKLGKCDCNDRMDGNSRPRVRRAFCIALLIRGVTTSTCYAFHNTPGRRHAGAFVLTQPVSRECPITSWGPCTSLLERSPLREVSSEMEVNDDDTLKPSLKSDSDRNSDDEEEDNGLPGTTDAFDAASQAILEWTSGTSIGSFLLQRQREEEDTIVQRALADSGGSEMTVLDQDQALSDAERLVRDQSRRMEGRKRRKERRKERRVEAQLEEIREMQQMQQRTLAGEVQIIDDTENSGVGKLLIEEEKMKAPVSIEWKKKSADTDNTEERRKKIRRWRRRKRDKAKAKQKGFLVDEDLARQVDDAVVPLKGSRSTIMNEIKQLNMTDAEVPSRVRVILPQSDDEGIENMVATTKKSRREALKKYLKMKSDMKRLPLSDPDHYYGRIEKDMRHIAIAIASSVDVDWQWRLFCEEGGGLYPLIHCIRDGARSIREGESLDEDGEEMFGLTDHHRETVAAANAACRNLRDLCALSPEFSAVVTDGILRADAALSMSIPNENEGAECLSGGLLSDLITLLRYGQKGLQPFLGGQAPPKSRGKMIGINRKASPKKTLSKQSRKNIRMARARSALYVVQLLLAMSVASDAAVNTMRSTSGLTDAIVAVSSYAPKERRRRWVRYPVEALKKRISNNKGEEGFSIDEEEKTVVSSSKKPFIAAASVVGKGIEGEIQRTSNMLLAALGHNCWLPKIPGQKGLRILCLDGGGSRGITAITSMRAIVEAMGGIEVADSFDIIAGTSTGAIIAFLVGLRRETSSQAKKRYDKLISKIFVKSALSGPMMVFTTAAYDEKYFNEVMEEVLGDTSMLESRADPTVPLVFCISSKMSSNPIQIALFRNYNYGGCVIPDSFTLDPEKARIQLGLPPEDDIMEQLSDWEEKGQVSGRCAPRREGSRHSGSFRILQRAALRATTAAPTFFKPVMMSGELYSDGGIVASNPAAVAIHEARTLFPDVPVEMVVSCGTGGFIEERAPPKIGWDGIIGQIVNSATDGEQIHHILEDIMGEGGTTSLGKSISQTKYYRFNPIVGTGDEFPIDVTDKNKLKKLAEITRNYMAQPEQQRKLREISDILEGKQGWRKIFTSSS